MADAPTKRGKSGRPSKDIPKLPQPAKIGRPSSYTPEVAEFICEEIATSDYGLERICSAENMPDARTVYRWLEAEPDFRQKYAHARERQGELLALQVIPIADDGSADMVTRYREDGTEYQAVDQEHINRSRLRIDARKWLASKLAPKKYGDRLELAGDKDSPLIPPRVVVEFVDAIAQITPAVQKRIEGE